MKRTITLLLLAAMLATTYACGDTTSNQGNDSSASVTDSTTAPVTEDPSIIPPEATDAYKGKTYRILNGYSDQTKYTTNDIYPEEMTGDTLNDALRKRCTDTEDRLGIKIEVSDGDFSQIRNNIAAMDDFADVTYVDLTNVMGLVTEGYCIDFYEIPNIDLSKVWWDHNAEDKLSFEGQLYYTFNDHIFTQTENCRAVFFNKELADDLKLENLYDAVRNGTWTIDLFEQCAKKAVSDLNGDGSIDSNDRVGIVNWGYIGLGEALLTGSDAEIVKINDKGDPYFYCFTEQFQNVYTRVLELMTKDDFTLLGGDPQKMFMNGQSLFWVNSLNSASQLREMKTDFGILPAPKYNSEQESYWNVSPNAHAMIVPVTVQDLEFAGAVMEELAYQSHKTLLPAYYETVLKGKTTRDDDSIEMLDVIHNSISYVIKIIGTEFSDAIYNEMANKNYSLSSMLDSWKPRVETQLADVLSQFENK